MSNTTYIKRGGLRKLCQSLLLFAVMAWLAMPASFVYFYYLHKISPQTPSDINCIEMHDHGYVFYITPGQNVAFYCLLCGGGILFLISILLWQFVSKRGFQGGH